jgi:hypothetical protein
MERLLDDIRFNKLTEKYILKELSLIFDTMLNNNKEKDIEHYLQKISLLSSNYNRSNTIPQHFFFIWIGILPSHTKYYPKIWLKSKVKPIFYYDSNAYLSGFYLTELKTIASNKNLDIIQIQNDFFKYYNKKNKVANSNFDAIFLNYLNINGINKNKYYNDKISSYIEEINKDLDFKFIDIHSINNLFIQKDFMKYYTYEIILRNNLAAASDIIRLLIIYKFGGIYSDLDTLPNFDYIFKKTNTTLNDVKDINKNIVDVIRTEELLCKIDNTHKESYSDNDIEILDTYMLYLKNFDLNIYKSILYDVSKWNKDIPEFLFPKINEKLICISASKNNLFEFNNNMIAAHANSKMIRILLRQLKKRYHYAEKRGFILNRLENKNIKINPYYERLKNYRLDGSSNSDNVTLILSGPSFILEVILGLSYQLLSINYDIDPLAISYALREKHIGLSLENQTMFTLEHIKSSWM